MAAAILGKLVKGTRPGPRFAYDRYGALPAAAAHSPKITMPRSKRARQGKRAAAKKGKGLVKYGFGRLKRMFLTRHIYTE